LHFIPAKHIAFFGSNAKHRSAFAGYPILSLIDLDSFPEGLPMTLNRAHPAALELLLTRRSVKTRDMVSPGPDDEALARILEAGMRVPDHGKLAPWRFFVFSGDAREALGDTIRTVYLEEQDSPSERVAASLAAYPLEAPLLVVLASTPSEAKPIPEWEQRLSTGAAGMAMLTAAHAMGFVGQWLTGWPAYSEGVKRSLGLGERDRIAGFLFFGSAKATPSERPRPAPETVIRRFRSRGDFEGNCGKGA